MRWHHRRLATEAKCSGSILDGVSWLLAHTGTAAGFPYPHAHTCMPLTEFWYKGLSYAILAFQGKRESTCEQSRESVNEWSAQNKQRADRATRVLWSPRLAVYDQNSSKFCAARKLWNCFLRFLGSFTLGKLILNVFFTLGKCDIYIYFNTCILNICIYVKWSTMWNKYKWK